MSKDVAMSSPADRNASTDGVIVIDHLVKTFGSVRAVDDLSFTVRPGRVTGFLGPNGAGKTTTLRILLGLVAPTAGTATIGGTTYGQVTPPMRAVGAALEAASFHPGRSALDHLRVYAPQAGVSDARCREVLAFVGLDTVAGRRAGGFSLGMRQRLALATTLLGDPPVLLLDEPANGLDPAGMAWLRRLLTDWAAQGRTVLFSSHVLTEVEFVADRIVIIDHGRVVREGAAEQLYGSERAVVVRAEDCESLKRLARDEGWTFRRDGADRLVIHGVSSAVVGSAVAGAGIALTELSSETSTRQLEDLFLDLTTAEDHA